MNPEDGWTNIAANHEMSTYLDWMSDFPTQIGKPPEDITWNDVLSSDG